MAITWSVLTGLKTVSGSIANWVNRSDLPTENILLEAQAWIYQQFRAREMMTRDAAFAFPASAQSVALPAGFLDPISFTPYGYCDPLLYVHEEKLEEQRDEDGALESGTPSRWTIIGETAYVDVNCLAAMTGVLLYYKQPDALSSSNGTNFLTTRYPTLLRTACMMKAYEHMKDSARSRDYLQIAMAALADAQRTDDLKRRGQYIPA